MAKPTKLPEWALTTIIDPSSGQSNIVEPTATRKKTGWIFKEFPPRQFFNWLSNLIYKWLKWFNEEITEIDSEFDDFSTELIIGFSVFTTKILKFKVLTSDAVYIIYDLEGTSNQTDLYFNLPSSIPSQYESGNVVAISRITDSGVDGIGYLNLSAGTRQVNIFPSLVFGSLWTASGTKKVKGNFIYRRG